MSNNSYLRNVCLTFIDVYFCVLFDTYDILLLIKKVINLSNFYYFENLYACNIHYKNYKVFIIVWLSCYTTSRGSVYLLVFYIAYILLFYYKFCTLFACI